MRSIAVAAALTLALPRAALACPACAGREGSATATLLLVGAMIALPFAVAALAFFAIRRQQAAEGRR